MEIISGVIEPLFVSHYELLNDKMEIVESKYKKIKYYKKWTIRRSI